MPSRMSCSLVTTCGSSRPASRTASRTLPITVDYLVVETATRRLLNAPTNHIETHAADLATLSDNDGATITNVIDALVTKAKLRLITTGAS